MITVRRGEATDERVVFTVDRSDGPSRELVYESSALALTADGDAAAVAALPLAMSAREPLRLEMPVSSRLRAALGPAQDVLSVWWQAPEAKIAVEAVAGDPTGRGDVHGGVFSHDLASHHLALAPGAPDLLFVVDADVAPGPALDRVGPPGDLPIVSTNLADVGAEFGLGWHEQYRGAALASVAHVIRDLDRVDLPAPFSVHYLFPWGSHAVLDPLWSGAGLEVRHRHADRDWVERLDLVASEADALAQVRACRRPDGSGPCGTCRGCLHHDAGLRVLGRGGAALDLDALGALDLSHYTALADTAVLLRHADRATDPELVDAIESAVRRLGPDDVQWPQNWFAYLGELGSAHR